MADAGVVKNLGHRWVKGQPSANPKGRPKTGTAFAEALREDVDPRELIRLTLAIARGEPAIRDLEYLRNARAAAARGEPPPEIRGVEVSWPTNSERLQAVAFLHGAGWQKPPQQVEVGPAPPPTLDPSLLTQEELDQLEAIQTKMLAEADRPEPPPGVDPRRVLDVEPSE